MKQTFLKIARWIIFFPCFLLVHFLVGVLMTLLNSRVFGQVPYMVNQPWFGGHYIAGPLFLIFKEAGSFFAALITAIYIVPNHKKITFYIFAALWMAILILTTGMNMVLYYPWSLEGIIRWLLPIGVDITILILLGTSLHNTPEEEFGREFSPF